MSPNVLMLPRILFTTLIPSIMHADGNRIDSAGATLLLICLAIVDLFVFLRVQSKLDNAKSYGPEGCFKTSLISRLRPVATKTIFPNNLLSTFRITSFPGTFVFFYLMELKVLSYSFGCLS